MDTIEDIDAKICLLEAELLVLRQRRNTLISFCNLPNEIMGYILLWAQQLSISSSKSISNDPVGDLSPKWPSAHHRSWMDLMFSCVHIRQVALGTPELWHTIRWPCNTQWRTLCLERANHMSPNLCITDKCDHYCDGEVDAVEDVVDAQLPHAINVFISRDHRECCGEDLDNSSDSDSDADSTSSDITAYLGEGLHRTWPHLQHLTLEWSRYGLTNQIMAGGSENITSLTLNIAYISSPPKVPNLRHLSITYNRRLAISEGGPLVIWLGECRKLEMLNLEFEPLDDGSSDKRDALQMPVPITMPSLTLLRLHASIGRCLFLLQVLPCPRIGLDVTIPEIGPRTMNSSPNPAYETLIQRVDHIWSTLTKHKPGPTPPLHCVASFSDIQECGILKLFSSPQISLAKAFCVLNGPYYPESYIFGHIRILHCLGERVGPLSTRDGSDPFKIWEIELDVVIAEGLTTETGISWFGKWLKQRKHRGRPIRSVLLRGRVTKNMEELMVRLKSRQVIETFEGSPSDSARGPM